MPDLPGPEAQLSMAPAYRSRITRTRLHDRKCTDAAVVVLLIPDGDSLSVVLTARRPDLKHHGGQISFPGGRREAGESLQETALRECNEEIGIAPCDVEVLGALTPLYIPPTHFCMHPFVGTCSTPTFRPDDREVDRVLTVSLPTLVDPTLRSTRKRTFGGKEYDVPYFAIDGEVVWGATAMVLAEFVAIADSASLPGR